MSLGPDGPKGVLPDEVIRGKRVKILPHHFYVSVDDEQLHLTNKEFQLLTFLARHPQRVLRRNEIAAAVWGGGVPGRTIDIHVSRLRAKLPPESIETVVRVGYRFVLI